ncbi:hypothetical protein H3430_003916 [Escherichia coli]|nr:hypothetical protein [Escherichia coli]
MRRMIISLLLATSSSAYAIDDPVLFVKQLPYKQVVKDVVLSRCLAQVADDESQFSVDAARSSNALMEWMPFDIENGNNKINAIIAKYKGTTNVFHSERQPAIQGVTLNCLRLYHSTELDKLTSQIIIGDPNNTWSQDNPH